MIKAYRTAERSNRLLGNIYDTIAPDRSLFTINMILNFVENTLGDIPTQPMKEPHTPEKMDMLLYLVSQFDELNKIKEGDNLKAHSVLDAARARAEECIKKDGWEEPLSEKEQKDRELNLRKFKVKLQVWQAQENTKKLASQPTHFLSEPISRIEPREKPKADDKQLSLSF